MSNILKRKKKKIVETPVDAPTPMLERVLIIICILLFLFLMLINGGHGQHWYPGKPFWYED